jgi:hypothetical protein
MTSGDQGLIKPANAVFIYYRAWDEALFAYEEGVIACKGRKSICLDRQSRNPRCRQPWQMNSAPSGRRSLKWIGKSVP